MATGTLTAGPLSPSANGRSVTWSAAASASSSAAERAPSLIQLAEAAGAGHALRDASDVAGTHLQPHPLGRPPRRHVVEADVELAVAGVIDPQHFGVHPTTIRFTR